jgi:hypothetical protein
MRNNRRFVGPIVLYAGLVLLKENRRLVCGSNGILSVSIKYKCPYLDAARVRVQRMLLLLRKTKGRPHFETHKLSWYEQKFYHESQQDPKPRTTVLARASSKLLDLDADVIPFG